ncbi:hypothetical protein AHAS_Ahas19G0187800 [Arachis hypogaea]
MKDSQKMKESVVAETVKGEFSASFTKEKKKVVVVGLMDEDDGYDMAEDDGSQSVIAIGVRSKATKIGSMSSQWLRKAFMKKICENPKIKLKTLMKKARSKWNIDLKRSKAARVKQLALDEINGTYREQYKRIHDYAAELLRSNPDFIWRLTSNSWMGPSDQILPITYAVVEAETKDSWT